MCPALLSAKTSAVTLPTLHKPHTRPMGAFAPLVYNTLHVSGAHSARLAARVPTDSSGSIAAQVRSRRRL